MKKYILLAAASLLLVSCFHVNTNFKGGKSAVKGEGPVVSKTFDFKDFDAIVINGGADVDFTQSSVYEVTVRTQENILDILDYQVDGTTLIIQTKDKKGVQAEQYNLVIQAPVLKSLVVNGASDFNVDGLRMDGDLDVQVNGAGDLDFGHVECGSFSVQINGAADANLTSIALLKDLKVAINGAGDVKVTGTATDADFAVNGAGSIDATGLTVAGEVKQHKAGIASIKF